MANETTSSTLSELYTEIVAEALFVAQEASVLRNLVTNYNISGQGKEISVPIYSAVSAAAVAEATDLSNTAVNPTEATFTASEHGVMTTLTDLGASTASRNVAADIGKLFGNAIAKRMDQDIIALFDGFSTVVGTNSAAWTAAKSFEAAAELRNQNLPVNECNLVIHPYIAYDLKANATNSFVNPADARLQNNVMGTGFVGSIAGMNVYDSSNIDTLGGVTGDYLFAAFHPSAIGLEMKQDLKIETQRDASLRGTEIVATAVWGEGEIHDAYGVECVADSSIKSP